MGMKSRPPKNPGDAPKRSDARKIIWEGHDRERPARIIAIDKGSNDPVPCQLIYEVLMQDTLMNESWGEQGYKGMSLLEKQLVVELTTLNGKMPKWGTAEAEAKRDEKMHEWVKKQQAFYEYERERAAAEKEAAADESRESFADGIARTGKGEN